MEKLLVVADDFTGALDTGVQFAVRGVRTCVAVDPGYDFSKAAEGETQVLVLNGETRHLSPEMAYKTVFEVVRRALGLGFDCIYKKTDSALRGNVGAELSAVLDAAEAEHLAFIPAFPKLRRITKKGTHYIDGMPVSESAFGQDPFEPVTVSQVAEIIKGQTNKPVVLHGRGETRGEERSGIHVYDAETDLDLLEIGSRLGRSGLRLSAGCAGFAAVLAEQLGLRGEISSPPTLVPALLVVCGSMNPTTLEQMKLAEEYGFPHVHLTPAQKLEEDWLRTRKAAEEISFWLETVRRERRLILDANDPDGCDDTERYARHRQLTAEDLRVGIVSGLGKLIRRLLDEGMEATILCTGGDTLLALMRSVGAAELAPVCEMDTGVVLTGFQYKGKNYHIISKSGGFGEPELFYKLAKTIGAQREEIICRQSMS